MLVSAQEAYRLWAPEYDSGLNPLLALEARTLQSRLGALRGSTFLDAGAGTGRWMICARRAGARTFGIDLSAEMLAVASGSLVRGDIRRLPFMDDAVDVAVCSMTLGYVRSAEEVLAELTRVARRVIVSDLHPAAVAAGWTRSFRTHGRKYEIEQYAHSVRDLRPDWFAEEYFGEPERHIFEAASKADTFGKMTAVPAIYAAGWSRQ
ncbi:MAG TPA: methyltransferase domain-containing protein [Bryobacteraceae bacterium]|nr:methyltransferase domain-containing protein [Bryobacteraceae bacterium]